MPAPVIVGTPETFFSAGVVGPHTLARPEGLQAGDVLVVWLRSQATDWAANWTPPVDWSHAGPAFVPNYTQRVGSWFLHPVSDPESEPEQYAFTPYSSSGRRGGALMVVRGAALSPALSGSSTAYAGTIVGGARADAFAVADVTGADHLVLFAGNSEFSSPNSHTPLTLPAGYAQVAEVVGPSASTGVSRTYFWVGSTVLAHDAGVTADAPILWAVAAGAQAQAIAFQGLADPDPDPDPPGTSLAYNGAGQPVEVYAVTPDGLEPPQALHYLTPGYPSIDAMLAAEDGFYWAHRGGSASFPEHSLHAYTQSVLRGFGALEISLNRTADGVWFGLHDANLDRTSQASLGIADASSMTWAEVQAHQITLGPGGPQPYMTWDQLIEAYGDSHVLVCDPKWRHASHRAEFLAKCVADLGPDRCIVKFSYDATSLKIAIANAGLRSWGYLYQSNMSDPDFASRASGWDMLGMEHSAPQGTWDTLLALGKPVVAHICATEAHVTAARAKGASGYQCSGTAVIRPA